MGSIVVVVVVPLLDASGEEVRIVDDFAFEQAVELVGIDAMRALDFAFQAQSRAFARSRYAEIRSSRVLTTCHCTSVDSRSCQGWGVRRPPGETNVRALVAAPDFVSDRNTPAH